MKVLLYTLEQAFTFRLSNKSPSTPIIWTIRTAADRLIFVRSSEA